MWVWKGVPAEDLEGTGVKDVGADAFGNKGSGVGKAETGDGNGGKLLDPSDHLLLALTRGYRVYLGKHVLAHVEAGEQVREVARAIPHPQYQEQSHPPEP